MIDQANRTDRNRLIEIAVVNCQPNLSNYYKKMYSYCKRFSFSGI